MKNVIRKFRYLFILAGILILPLALTASTASQFVMTSVGNSTVKASATNKVLMFFHMPAPIADTLVHDGAGYAVTQGNSLTAFAVNDEYADVAHDNGVTLYSGTELIVNSADASITSAEVITPGTADLSDAWGNIQFGDEDHDDDQDYDGNGTDVLLVNSNDTFITDTEIIHTGLADLTAFNSVESSLNIYLDHTNDDAYTGNPNDEDIFVMAHNGSDGYASPATIQRTDPNDLSFYDDHTGTEDDYDDGEAIISDADSDGYPSSGDIVKTAGKAKVEALTASDNVCFDGSGAGDDNEFDPGEVIWWDVAGDCSAFTSTTDVILVGGAAPVNTLTEFGVEQEVAFLDEDNNGAYTCSRTGTCEPIVYSGANGVDLADDANLPTTTVFYDSSTEGTDGIATTGTGWDESGGTEDLIDFNDAVSFYLYVSGGAYADGDDIFRMLTNGNDAAYADGDESRIFGVNEKFSDATGTGLYTGYELIANSADANLASGEVTTEGNVDVTAFGGNYKYSDADNNSGYTAGELIANSADANLAGAEIKLNGNVDITAFDASTRFHDGSGGGVYNDGEDIARDNDSSTYYNADQLTSLTIGNAGACVDADLAVLKIWEDTNGNNGFDSGIDTVIGFDNAIPILNQVIPTAGSVYFQGSFSQGIFVTADTAVAPTPGCTFIPKIPFNANSLLAGAQFTSINDGPTDSDATGPNTTTVDTVKPTFAITTETVDFNVDGTIDQIVVNFSENVTIWDAGGLGNGLSSLALTDGCTTIANGNYAINNSNTVTLNVSGCTAGNTGITPTVTYAAQGCGNDTAICDQASNEMDNLETIDAADGAAPVYVSSETIDNGSDGLIDRIRIIYSEDIDESTVLASDFQAGIGSPILDANLIESSPSVDEASVFVNVTDGNEHILPDKTDYALLIKQVGTVSDLEGNPSGLFGDQTSADGAPPRIINGQYDDADHDGTIETVVLVYTETVNFTMVGGKWEFNLANDLGMANDFGGGECGTGSDTIMCVANGGGDFVSDAGKTGVGASGQEPEWEFTSDASVQDTAINPNDAPTQTVTLQDIAMPIVWQAAVDYADNVSELVVTFTEEVTAATCDETKFHIADATGENQVPLTENTTTLADSASLTIPLTEAQRLAAILISNTPVVGDGDAVRLDVDAGAVTDTAGMASPNPTNNDNNVHEDYDTYPPELGSSDLSSPWVLDYDAGTLTLYFSETVESDSVTPTAITIQNAISGSPDLFHTLTDSTVAPGDSDVIVINLSVDDLNALKGTAGLAKTYEDAYLSATALLVDDMSANPIVAIPGTWAIQAYDVIGSGTFGDLEGSVALSYNALNSPANAGIHFTTAPALPGESKIVVTFPAGFRLDGASNIENANIDGDFTAVPVGQTVTITRTGGTDILVPTDVNFDLVRVVNPSVLGTTGTFAITTKTAGDAILDQDLAVAGQYIIMPPIPVNPTPTGGGGGGGGGGSGGGYRSPGVYLMNPVLSKTEEEEGAEEGMEEAPDLAPAAGPAAFEDVQGHWAETYIAQIADMGIVSGKSAEEFAPDDNISRAELLKVALGAFDITVPEAVTEKPLPDVEIGDWYAPYVKAGFDNGLIYGFENGFEPNTAASRGMSATVLTKAAGFDDVEQYFADNYSSHTDWTYAHFPDVLMDAYYAPFVAYLYDKGIISGYEDGTYGPGNPITRAEIAKIVVNLLEMYTPTTSETPAAEESAAPAEESAAESAGTESADAEMMEGQGL